MKNQIHPTAIVHESAQLGTDNYIGPFCLIGPNVRIGNGNRFEAYVSIGTAAEHRDYFHEEPGPVIMGDGNVLREQCTVNGGSNGVTQMGSEIIMLKGAHVGHDAIVRNRATLSSFTVLSGHTIIGEGANLGLHTVVHQYRSVGAFAMVGMNSSITRDLPPFAVSFGSPARHHRVNRVGLERAGVTSAEIERFENWYRLYSDGEVLPPLNHAFSKFLDQYAADCATYQPKPKNRAA